jgi:Cdc6-like AAA superfamily ATPase
MKYHCDADISGVPGAGKTATVHAVVRELKQMAEQNVYSPSSLTPLFTHQFAGS